MSRRNQRQTECKQPEDSCTGEFALEEDGNTENGEVHIMDFRPDPKATCLRLEQGIPQLLAMIVPSNLEIKEVGDLGKDKLYIVHQIVAYGTVDDIVQQIAQLQK